ncbi:MAG: 4-hydroxythreonine-4-phosphate dehydrogenase PdxA [Saprospiraceae bacterium]|nr:4-hydroxythreonine-4-phosphate dehydrogenase PdxA [Saprospiraceae bacterium]
MNKPKIGISIGDINGVGLEVVLKTLSNSEIVNLCIPVIYGSAKVISYHKNIVNIDFQFSSTNSSEKLNFHKINIINCWQENVNITLGKPTEQSGQYAFRSLETAVFDLKNNKIDALVTAPINKEAMKMAAFPFPGHTEYITSTLGVRESLMFMINDGLRIGLATNHIPLRDVAQTITKEQVIDKLRIMEECLKMDFGIERPVIGVLGLNPHASDNGVMGDEEENIIRPAIVECKKRGMMVMGPFAADGFFGSQQYRKFDAIMAMYHDQGLIPFKALTFGSGVNYTAGLPVVRTSPDHGTGYDIVGKNLANPDSFRHALFTAIEIAKNRSNYHEMHANQLVKKDKPKYNEKDDEALPEDDDRINV